MSKDLKFHVWSPVEADREWQSLAEKIQHVKAEIAQKEAHEDFWERVSLMKGGFVLADYFLRADSAPATKLRVGMELDFLFGSILTAEQSVIDQGQEFILAIMESEDLHNQTARWPSFIAQLNEERIEEIAKEANPEKYTDPAVNPDDLWVYPHHATYVRITRQFFAALQTLVDQTRSHEGSKIVTELYGGPDVQEFTDEMTSRVSLRLRDYGNLLD